MNKRRMSDARKAWRHGVTDPPGLCPDQSDCPVKSLAAVDGGSRGKSQVFASLSISVLEVVVLENQD